MPLTIAHPAAAVPLRKLFGVPLPLSALVIGSMMPDLVYLLPLGIRRADTHDFVALFWFCLPAGLAVYLLYHLLLAPIGARLLPEPISSRLPSSIFSGSLPAVAWIKIAASLLLGAATHLLVDSVTHRDGFVVALLPFLRTPVCSISAHKVCIFKTLQYAGSVAGLLLLWVWILGWMARTPPDPASCHRRTHPALRLSGFCLLIALPVAAGVLAALLHDGGGGWLLEMKRWSRALLVNGGTVFCANWIALGLLGRFWRARTAPAAVRPLPAEHLR